MLNASLEGNPSLCQTDSCQKKKHSVLLPIVTSFATVMVLLFLSTIFFFWRMKRQEGNISFYNNDHLHCCKDDIYNYFFFFLHICIFQFPSILMLSQFPATSQSKKEGLVISTNRSFSYSEIVSITNNFETIIGEGGFGKVYFGTLKDNVQVAVKLLSQNSRQGYKEFQSEVRFCKFNVNRITCSLFES